MGDGRWNGRATVWTSPPTPRPAASRLGWTERDWTDWRCRIISHNFAGIAFVRSDYQVTAAAAAVLCFLCRSFLRTRVISRNEEGRGNKDGMTTENDEIGV